MPEIAIYWVIPFVLILLSIAILPLVVPHFWEKNRNKGLVSFGLALPVAIYLFKFHPQALSHSLQEYVSFIILLGSLFVISGGICLTGDLKASPKTNVIFLGLGAIFANLIGTTGASMLLIRPYLKSNQGRSQLKHLPIFFIFIVSNIGGLLTPIGDPPLFLGYLRDVPFFWTLKLVPIWLTANTVLLFLFYLVDSRAFKKESIPLAPLAHQKACEPLKILGGFNFFILIGVVGSVFLDSPYRELSMGALAIASYFFTPQTIHEKNRFNFHPINEVAILFIGIFIAMVPALELLQTHGSALGISQQYEFFWFTGMLSGFLDNAPTYLSFFSLAQGLHLSGPTISGVPEPILMAISAGAVLMGSLTYIGNGPNFMVKAIAEESGIKTASFFGYMAVSWGILIPLFLVITFLFFI